MARTGLRMMPTFPSPPLKSRTAGFPQYGFKASVSDRTFRNASRLACSRHSLAAVPFDTVLRPLYSRRVGLALSPDPACIHEPLLKRHLPLYPRRPWLRFDLCCLDPSLPNTTPCASPAGTLRFRFSLIRNAFAVWERRGRPAGPSLLSLLCFPYMSPTLPRRSAVSLRTFPLLALLVAEQRWESG